ncbi:A disintegrin and metalloproteinase with thrombospondin motifs 3-like isoform X2 [Haliotis asinina]|uniref:A disintegrin and metalloproteinase with thrombospondin motifs 3-like isoform X2 n=1 Tax=Haliotis asinina TaxID=109174 RepID=UPI003531E346
MKATLAMNAFRSVRCFCFLCVLVVAVCAEEESDGTRLPFKPPCAVQRTEIAFPHVIDNHGKHYKSEIPGSTDLPQFFFLEVSWRKQKIQLALYQSQISTPRAVAEWDEGNETLAEDIDDKCFYHGYVKGHRSSYTAVSTCSGVAGYIQTDDEILFIEPAASRQGDTSLQAHMIYTCEDREPANENHQWAPKDYNDGQMDAHWRKKRAARGRTKHLEVFMAVAPSTVQVVGRKKVKAYVMTLMNIVNSIYQHSSLDVDIRVSLVRLNLLNDRTADRVTVRRNAYQTVRNFCEWAMYLYRPSDPQTHDIAVLLTREDIGPAGYAPITGLCNPIRSCAAIKDEGFTSAFIIAHEMAHVFGLFHDGHGNRCHGREYRTAIMATLVESKLNHYWWSICSQERMKSLVNSLYCLFDDPYELEGLPELPAAIGKNWSLNEQCILEFGEQFSVCRAVMDFLQFYSDSCNMLWCGDYRRPHLCRTKRGPPAPGTPCGRDKQCLNGRCEYVGNQSPVHGRWGYWSSWTPCSAECGVGLRYRSRTCDNPRPKYGGRDCEGGKDEMGTCLNEKCSTYTDIRAGECEVWEEMNIRPGRHTWKPFPAKNKEDWCRQTCKSDRTGEVVTIDIDTEDGTPCTYDNDFSICIQGKCFDVGCDGVMNSTKKSDSCGVCGGDNSFCKTVTGEFLRRPSKEDEYEQVVFLPHGARNVEITKTEESPHFLAMKDPSRGDYYMNGNGKQEGSKQLVAEGAFFTYARGQTYESLVSRGPLKKNLEIMLFPAGHLAPASVTYAYTVNKDDHTLEKTKYKWKFTKWSECSVTCGTGVQTIMHGCFDKNTDERLNDEMCSFLDLPRQDQATCHRESCDQIRYIWAMFNNFSDCSASCGDRGYKLQMYGCERNYPNATTEYVPHHFCEKVAPPNETVECNRFPCILNWSVGEWSECSKTCGMGMQQREVWCGDLYDWSEDDVCDEDIPTAEKICSKGPCFPEPPPSCKKDKYSFCKYASVKKCRFAGFRKMCCLSCFKGTGAAYRRHTRMVRQRRKLRIKRRLKAKRRENHILKYN